MYWKEIRDFIENNICKFTKKDCNVLSFMVEFLVFSKFTLHIVSRGINK
jgi:hypothetical protein